LNKKVDKKAIGMIHKALANLTVVAISSAEIRIYFGTNH
jgi:hypothetical protein